MRILLRAAQLADERAGDIAGTISAEVGKTITEATERRRGPARSSGWRRSRAPSCTVTRCPRRQPRNRSGQDRLHAPAALRRRCRDLLFNYPALLVLHKVAPALAAGNAVVLKPARTTPLTALALAACFVDAGLPEGVLSVLTGPGGELGDLLVSDPRVRKISFTGSTAIGERITRMAGVKKLSLELGASCPVIIMPDADLDLAASAVAAGGYVNAGQVCISVQRVIAHPAVSGDFLDALVPKVEAIRVGDPSSPATEMGTLISTGEAERVRQSIAAAAAAGARVLTGGDRDGSMVAPTVVADVDPSSPFAQDELFGPAVAVSYRRRLGVRRGASQRHRLWTGGRHLHLGRRRCGPGDAGDRRRQHPHQLDSAVARGPDALRRPQGQRHRQEGPRWAVEEMTELKTVILHGRPW